MASSADEAGPGGVCLTCGRPDCDPQDHHPAGEYNVAEITVPECTPGCHEVLTERQRVAGVKLDRRLTRSEAERSWALLQGVADAVALLARNRGLTEVAVTLESAGATLGRLLCMLTPAEWSSRTGAAGDVGPNPRGNDRREALRSRKGETLPAVAGDYPAPGSVGEAERAETLVGLLAQTEGYLFGQDQLASIDLPALIGRLDELAERGAMDRLVDWGRRMAPDMAGALGIWRAVDGVAAIGDALGSTVWLAELSDAAVALLAGVAAAEDIDRAEGLVDAFMEAWPPASPTAP